MIYNVSEIFIYIYIGFCYLLLCTFIITFHGLCGMPVFTYREIYDNKKPRLYIPGRPSIYINVIPVNVLSYIIEWSD